MIHNKSRLLAVGLLWALAAAFAEAKASRQIMELPHNLEQELRRSAPGDIVDMGAFPMADVPLLDYTKRASGPPMVFSDDPEYFRVAEGAGVRERVEAGLVRLYVYHVNATTDSAKRISTVIENLGTGPLTLRFRRYASCGPSKDYYQVGKQGLIDYFSGRVPAESLVVPVGEAAPLDARMDRMAVAFDELVHGFYDFEIDQPALITTLQTTLETPAVVAHRRIREVLPPRQVSGAGRGLYPETTFDIGLDQGRVYDTAQGPKQLLVADGRHDPWIEGHDSSRHTTSTLKGNYGVIYRIRIPYRSRDGRAVAVVIWYPRAGDKWCEACALAVQVNDGVHPGGVVPIPRQGVAFRGRTRVGVVQIYPPCRTNDGQIEILYSPPGASCLPTPLLLLPIAWPH